MLTRGAIADALPRLAPPTFAPDVYFVEASNSRGAALCMLFQSGPLRCGGSHGFFSRISTLRSKMRLFVAALSAMVAASVKPCATRP
jgi:hypothetical protein